MGETSTRNVSTALYQYLCQYIVGTEEHVKTIRMMNSVRDNYQSTKKEKMITSGSFGEGLEMRGSDIDVMLVRSDIDVSEDTLIYFNAAKVHFTMDIENTKSGYTKLRLHHYPHKKILKLCHEIGDTGSARQAFMQSKELFPDEKNNTAFQRLSLIG
ncbi:unnamed protein product [Mytilus edulis]|uniref:Uncharacterized protein n=1 Tax=Mytilus edulis TaxID=6550 RepID=A0A8S3ULY6_MYTED|nr:unnamed protein product [Mytilus edulis]